MGIDALEAKICAQTSDTLRDNLRSKDVLSTSEAAKYLGVCRTTVSRYLALGMLPAVQLPGKNLFRKTDLDKILNLETGVTRLKGEVSGIDTDTSNLTTIDRASKYYGASAVTMLKILNDRGILPIVFAGINYFKKDDIRRIFGSSPLKDTVKTQQWVTHEQIELEYRMTYTAVTRLLRELKIPSKRVNRVTYYSMDHVKARKKEMDAAFSELYYT
ncbi:MAG: helix-turn-helix domain-containing protein, partial [Bacteroidales bacterium]|nr:helix-turn-helix domain-containing protein [Candidatus Cacconaster equi]